MTVISMDSEALITSLLTPINCIVKDKLFLGNQSAAEDIELLRRYGITHIVQCTTATSNPFPNQFTYLTLEVPDIPSFDFESLFLKANEFISNALNASNNNNNNNDNNNNNRVLVHCSAGASRSPTIVIAYLMQTTYKPLSEVLEMVQSIRPIVNPNSGFRKQLETFERRLLEKREVEEEEERDGSLQQSSYSNSGIHL